MASYRDVDGFTYSRSPARRADGSLFLETGKFMHLCDWLVPKAPQ